MAAVQSLRLCGRACRHPSAPQRIAPHILNSRRALSSTPALRDSNNGRDSNSGRGKRASLEDRGPRYDFTSNGSKTGELLVRFDEASDTVKVATPRRSEKVLAGLQAGLSQEHKQKYENILSYADKHLLDPGPRRRASRENLKKAEDTAFEMLQRSDRSTMLDDAEESMKDLDEWASEVNRLVKVKRDSFWGEDEEDQDLVTEDMDDDMDFGEDDIMSLAHGKLEEHREYREYARVAAWQMPLLSSEYFYAKTWCPVRFLLTLNSRTGTTIRAPDGRGLFTVPLHDLHGRESPGTKQSSCRVLTAGSTTQRRATTETQEAPGRAMEPRDGRCQDEL
jgi:hypothetical protein